MRVGVLKTEDEDYTENHFGNIGQLPPVSQQEYNRKKKIYYERAGEIRFQPLHAHGPRFFLVVEADLCQN